MMMHSSKIRFEGEAFCNTNFRTNDLIQDSLETVSADAYLIAFKRKSKGFLVDRASTPKIVILDVTMRKSS